MANHACVAIGINRYQFLPPLSYGQADAQALWHFLVSQANLPPNECLLLTDTSPLADNQSTYPTGNNIWRCIAQAERQTSWYLKNWRWFFFSGYGVSWERVDYLLPVDANPKDIPGTGIPVRSLLSSLKAHGDENLLVLLDINRAPGLQAGAPVGQETVELARQMGITLVLSSQLDQFSHEAGALGHGLFTAALLEALRYYYSDMTLEHLEQYLRDRLPELSQHHWRPIQTPLIVLPTNIAKQQLILPRVLDSRVREQNPVATPIAYIPRTRLEVEDAFRDNSLNGTAALRQKSAVSAVERQANTVLVSTTPAENSNQRASMPLAIVPSTNRQSQSSASKTPWWRALLLWGGAALVLALMVVPVVLRNRDALTNKQAIQPPPAQESPVSPRRQASPTTSPQNAAPTDSTKPSVASPQISVQRRLQANQAALDRARRLLRPNQASLFNQAIVQARSVKPGDPLYRQAKQDIKRWSAVILDLAEGRALGGNLRGAIAAAQMVPKDDPSMYAKAQQSIKQWKILGTQWQQNKSIIQAAKQQIQPNQASSYSRAITTLRQIPSGQPAYGEAQQLIAQWSRTIYLIANSRASRGNLKQAIQTAALVPTGTLYSDAAKKAIAKWQQGKR